MIQPWSKCKFSGKLIHNMLQATIMKNRAKKINPVDYNPKDVNRYLSGLLDKLNLGHIKGSWEDRWIESDGVKLYTPVFPSGEGKPTVVFIPGTAVHSFFYAELLHGLWKAGLNVVSLDPRGQGFSGGDRGDYTIMEQVENARTVVDYARSRFKGPVFVMGSSQGGIESFYLAASDNNGIDGAICHNIADLPNPASLRLTRFGPRHKKVGAVPTTSMVIMSRVLIGMFAVIAKAFPGLKVPASLYLDLKKEKMRVYGSLWNFMREEPLSLESITLRAFYSIATTPLPRPVAGIKTPVFVLHSSGDNVFPEDYIVDLYNRLTCDKEMKIYPDLPHLITVEYVPTILPDVVRWIQSKTQAQGR